MAVCSPLLNGARDTVRPLIVHVPCARQADIRFSSNGNPLLARPFINVSTGRPDATLIASPGIAAGTVTVRVRTALSGAAANLTARLLCSDEFYLTALGGFRFLRLEDEVEVDERFKVAPDVPDFGDNTVGLVDEFRSANRFYGGQFGPETGVWFDRLTVDFRDFWLRG